MTFVLKIHILFWTCCSVLLKHIVNLKLKLKTKCGIQCTIPDHVSKKLHSTLKVQLCCEQPTRSPNGAAVVLSKTTDTGFFNTRSLLARVCHVHLFWFELIQHLFSISKNDYKFQTETYDSMIYFTLLEPCTHFHHITASVQSEVTWPSFHSIGPLCGVWYINCEQS